MRNILIFYLWLTAPTHAYRIQGSIDEDKPFLPYEKGFVSHVQDPIAARRPRVNPGYASSVFLEDGAGKNRIFKCPQMVGPIEDKYYCKGKEYGYCDRRSGTCFCNDGYMGESCESCDPSHFEIGGLCYPKTLCPNDCSNAGVCNYLTGQCICSDHREGEDCSVSKCTTHHEFCTHCNDDHCIECEQGWSVMSEAEVGSQCAPCHRFDPRCLNCNATACTSCVDLLLFSIRRSGRRPQDPPLPIDELNRELSITVPFGSTQEDAFYDAEHYFLVEPELVPLKESAVQCHQGLTSDDSIECIPYNMTSHIMCGNHGTITFVSPEYAVREDANHIRLTLQRSGGGVGEASVTYSIYPITAGYEDVTSTAHYTSNQTIVFRHGQVRASFLITINDDRIMERNETFSVHLSNPRPLGKVRLGTQQRTIVTIIDDDEHRTCSSKSSLSQNETNLGVTEAGTPLQFTVNAVSCSGRAQTDGGDIFKAVVHKGNSADGLSHGVAPFFLESWIDSEDGTYEGNVNVTTTGNYEVDVYLLIPGGLRGSYFTDTFLSQSSMDLVRIDASVNFTFGTGPITTFGRDFVSVRWEGCILPLYSETYHFWLDVDDQARLWIDDELIIDWWAFSRSSAMHAEHELQAFVTHDIVLEYRDITGNATARLFWSSLHTPFSAIPSSSLLYKEQIGRYDFTVHPSVVNAQESMATGEGINKGVAGKELSFTVQPNDVYGNFRGWPFESLPRDSRHRDNVRSTATLLESNMGEVYVPVNMVYDETTRNFRATYKPITSGLYQLNVTIHSVRDNGEAIEHIFGSPFVVEVQPGATFAPQSIAYGGFGHCPPGLIPDCSGLYHGMAGMNSTFIIEGYDIHRNKRNIGGDQWTITVSNKNDYSDYHYGFVEDRSDGTYSVSIMPMRAGLNELNVKLNGSHIRGSPFGMRVVANEVVGSPSLVQEAMIVTSIGDELVTLELVERD